MSTFGRVPSGEEVVIIGDSIYDVRCGVPYQATTIATTFMTPAGPFATYTSFFGSGFRRTVLWRTIQISAITTIISQSESSSRRATKS